MVISRDNDDDPIMLNAFDEPGGSLHSMEYERVLQYFHSLLFDPAPPRDMPACLALHDKAGETVRVIHELRDALKQASNGDFSWKITSRGFVSGTLKALQAHLSHMAWMMQRVANGDLDQIMDFMGQLADSFNAMTGRLSSTLEELRLREAALKQLASELQHEIETRKETEEKLFSEEERWQLAVQCSRDGIWDVNLETDAPPYYSPRFLELTGMRPSEMADVREWGKLLHPEDHEALAMFRSFSSEHEIPRSFTVDHRLLCADGEYHWFMTRVMTVMNPETHRPARLIGVTADIQERKEREEFFSHRATHDSLTGLPNRAFFDERLKKSIEFAKRNGTHLAVIMADLDNFKTINDTLGHHAGDVLLIETAGRLQRNIRESDTVSRFGGDEFALLFSFGKNEWQSITRMLNRTMRSLHKPIQIEGQDLVVTASLGICICPGDGDNPKELLMRADEAMYYAKAQGRNACAFWKPNRQYNVVKFEKHCMTDEGQENA